MEQILNRITNVLSLGWVGTLIGIIGLVPIIFSIKSLFSKKLIRFTVDSYNLIDSTGSYLPEEIVLLHKNQQVPRLCKSTIRFWSASKLLIEGTSIAKNDRLRIAFSPTDSLLKIEIARFSKKANGISLEKEQNSEDWLINFDFLDTGDGAFIDLLYTSNAAHIAVLGTFKGQTHPPERVLTEELSRIALLQTIKQMLSAISIMLFGLMGLNYFSERFDSMMQFILFSMWLVISALCLFFILLFKSPIPKQMSNFPKSSAFDILKI